MSAESERVPRRWLNGVYRHAIVAVAFLAMTVVMVWPVTTLPRLGIGSYGGDALLNAWALAWNNHVMSTGTAASYFDANSFYPAAHALARSEHLFGISLATLPVHAMTRDALLGYDIAWLLSFPFSAYSAYALAGIVATSVHARVCAGAMYAFAFYRFEHAVHLHLLWGVALPITLLYLHRWWHQPTRANLGLWALLVLLQCLCSWYLAVMCAFANGALFVWLALPVARDRLRAAGALRHTSPGPLPLAAFALSVVVIGAALYPFARPYLANPPAVAGEAAANSASPAGYVRPPAGTLPARWLAAVGVMPRSWSFEDTNYIGMAGLLLTVLALPGLMRRECRERGAMPAFFVALGIAALLVSFGPGIAGSPVEGWSPYDLLRRLPGMATFRAPARFALLVSLAMAMVGACGADLVRKKFGAAAVWLLTAIMLLEVAPIWYELGRPRPVARPRIYAMLRQYPPAPVVSLPAFTSPPFDWFEAEYLLSATEHWFPIVNGYSRFVPDGHRERMQRIAAFPGAESIDELRRLGVGYVITHTERYGVNLRAMIAEARRAPDVELIATSGPDYLWRVRPGP
jgi:hypothetical protein